MDYDEDIEPLANYSNLQTMEVGGTMKHQPAIVLIDTDSTNNFMDRKVVARLAYHIEGCDRFEVKIIDGRILTCDSKCSKKNLIIQGHEILATITTLKDQPVVYTVRKWRPYLLDQRVVMRYR